MSTMPLQADETLLLGAWVETAHGVEADATCKRIESLVRESLRQVAHHPEYGAWETLFQDPADARYWERFYPQGEMQGGGPPALRLLEGAAAKAKYQL